MILRKPYALFIKIFKPIHILLSVLLVLLIYNTNRILSFFNYHITSYESVIGQAIKSELVTSSIFVIPIVIIVFSLIFFGIMFSKKKPVTFYLINIFSFLIVLIINIYSSNFLGIMEKSNISVKLIKLNHDLVLINMIIEIIFFICFVVRGLGIDFKKFNFNSDVTNLDINDLDREEFELNINIDLDMAKRNRKRKIRKLKYIYVENKTMISLVCSILIIIGVIISLFIVFAKEKVNSEGVSYNIDNFNIIVNNTSLIKEDFSGKSLTDGNLIVVNFSLKSEFSGVSLLLKNFSLQAEKQNYKVESKYKDYLIDLGTMYNNYALSKNYKNYLLIFEIPEKYVKSDMYLIYNNQGEKFKIKLNPQNLLSEESLSIKKIGESISFNESLGEITFLVNSFDIKDRFLIKYNYCVSKNDCILSREYIKPSINENFDKIVLKLNVNYEDKSNLGIEKFYDLFYNFGDIAYKIGDKWFYQYSKFEELKSKKTDNKNNVYIGINSNILNAESIKLVFNIRKSKYEYILK